MKALTIFCAPLTVVVEEAPINFGITQIPPGILDVLVVSSAPSNSAILSSPSNSAACIVGVLFVDGAAGEVVLAT